MSKMANENRLIDAVGLVEAIVNTPSEVAKFHTYNVLNSLVDRWYEDDFCSYGERK